MSMTFYSSHPMQFKLTSNSTNWDVFSATEVANDLNKWDLNSVKIANSNISMKITLLFDSPATAIINGSEYVAPDFYSTSEFVPVKSLKIKESGISFLLILAIA